MEPKKSWDAAYQRIEFEFEGRAGVLVCPPKPLAERKWFYKMEYLGAFPSFQKEMLDRGYFVAYLQNQCRWCPKEDRAIRPRFCRFMQEQFDLHPQCVPIGMSCGGLQAVYFAAEHPEYVAAVYLDAPVLNYLSCPFALGAATVNFAAEFERDMGLSLAQMLNFRDHPIDAVPQMIQNRIPAALICGDRDQTVPYAENGALLAAQYHQSDVPFFEILKENCDHHPHGLQDQTPLIAFLEKYY